MTIASLFGADLTALANATEGLQMLPSAHHGGFHMDEWPWWPGPMHIAYPLLFFAGVVVVGILLWRKS